MNVQHRWDHDGEAYNNLRSVFTSPSSRAELTARELGCIFWHPSTRAVNSGSGNRPLQSTFASKILSRHLVSNSAVSTDTINTHGNSLFNVLSHQLNKCLTVGTCEASRFDSNWTIPIRFDSKVTGWFEIFDSAAPAVVPQITLTVQQKNFNRCAVVIEIILFYVLILCLCSKSIHTR